MEQSELERKYEELKRQSEMLVKALREARPFLTWAPEALREQVAAALAQYHAATEEATR